MRKTFTAFIKVTIEEGEDAERYPLPSRPQEIADWLNDELETSEVCPFIGYVEVMRNA